MVKATVPTTNTSHQKAQRSAFWSSSARNLISLCNSRMVA